MRILTDTETKAVSGAGTSWGNPGTSNSASNGNPGTSNNASNGNPGNSSPSNRNTAGR